jgi:hypothetical protein
MKLTTKLLLLAGVVWSAIMIDRKRRPMRAMGAGATTVGTAPELLRNGTILDAELVGISEVDPEGLAGMGEGIDPEAIEHAHGKKMF